MNSTAIREEKESEDDEILQDIFREIEENQEEEFKKNIFEFRNTIKSLGVNQNSLGYDLISIGTLGGLVVIKKMMKK